MRQVEVVQVSGTELAEPLELLEKSLRDGEPVPATFAERFREALEAGDLELLAARERDRVVGVAVLAFRLSVSAGGIFASIEDLYVRVEARRVGVGRSLLEVIGERCAARGVSYIEAQVEDGQAGAFYAACGYNAEGGLRVFSRSYALAPPPEVQ
ncbi:MAG: GNAT family N-acetyltransferase [Actinomycetota bacterium]|nr:GNAT family N-acetyltransferase [Actinomycetota bacterium]